ncbi:MAG: hypothetical protein HYU39_06040 [Thaumarchaeota archaeon]|nr:hypothetical protein [Nitrososphaerota archaeon]
MVTLVEVTVTVCPTPDTVFVTVKLEGETNDGEAKEYAATPAAAMKRIRKMAACLLRLGKLFELIIIVDH